MASGNLAAGDLVSNAASRLWVLGGDAGTVVGVLKAASGQTGDLLQLKNNAGTNLLYVQAAGHLNFGEAVDLRFGSTTGTKIGTATTQKLGFWNAAPAVQPTNVANPTGGAIIDAESRTAIDAILSRLETIGIFAA